MENRVAQVAVEGATYAIDRPFSYAIPPDLRPTLCPGVRVLVSFGGGNRRCLGVVLRVESCEEERACKPILAQLEEEPLLNEEGIRLALWMREQWFCTAFDAFRAMLPAGLWFSLQDTWSLAEGVDREAAYEAAGRSQLCRQVLQLLYANGGQMELGKLREAFGTRNPTAALNTLAQRGVLTLTTSASRGIGDKTEQIASLALPAEEALALVEKDRRHSALQTSVTQLLCAIGSASTKEICYFTGASLSTIKSLQKKGVVKLEKREVFRRVVRDLPCPAPQISLNAAQSEAFSGLQKLLLQEEAAAALLYGVTGSGKTQVYLQLIHQCLYLGQTALVLVPEIALTPQLLSIFLAHFGDRVAVLHSSLRAGERYDEWKRARQGKAQVVIGTRSAVFAPLDNIGLIVLDEEQEYSYKSEQLPRYHAREVAKYRCVHHKALLLLCSATPSVESMYLAKTGKYHLFTLPGRFNRQAMPQVQVVDMKGELRQGNASDLSMPLQQELAENLRRGEQSILLLNRRGASRMLSCGVCGAVPTCPRCSVYLTYHSANGRLMCHYCGYSAPAPGKCPDCGGSYRFLGTGTQRVQQQLQQTFPGVEVLRMDTDTVTATNTHEKMFAAFVQKNIPILVGTQMVAKGLDFENVTLVGVLAADLGLYVDDFRGGERVFSLITQAVGRSGRGKKAGRAIIQTWTPENDIILCASRQEYPRFYEQEIALRQLRGFPPFQDLFLLSALGMEENRVLHALLRLRSSLEGALQLPQWQGSGVTVMGPAPAGIAKINNRYRYQLTVVGKNQRDLRALLAHLLRQAQQDKENKGVTIYGDVNPLE